MKDIFIYQLHSLLKITVIEYDGNAIWKFKNSIKIIFQQFTSLSFQINYDYIEQNRLLLKLKFHYLNTRELDKIIKIYYQQQLYAFLSRNQQLFILITYCVKKYLLNFTKSEDKIRMQYNPSEIFFKTID